jgi:hypothetical protein
MDLVRDCIDTVLWTIFTIAVHTPQAPVFHKANMDRTTTFSRSWDVKEPIAQLFLPR